MNRYNYKTAMNILTNGDKALEKKISDLVNSYDAIDERTDTNAFDKMMDLATEFFSLNVNLKTAIMDVSIGTNWASYEYIKYGIEIKDPDKKKVSNLNLFLALIGSETWRRGINF